MVRISLALFSNESTNEAVIIIGANESIIDSCFYHKTIHLQTSLGSPNGYQLQWTEYEGFPYSTYNI